VEGVAVSRFQLEGVVDTERGEHAHRHRVPNFATKSDAHFHTCTWLCRRL
jgi:hypothetical protein